jgi:hypothetical protein
MYLHLGFVMPSSVNTNIYTYNVDKYLALGNFAAF